MHSAGPYSTYRLFEWCMATMMVLIAFTLAMPGDTMEWNALKPIAEMGFSEANMALIFGCVGSVRIMALFLNGYINNVRVEPKGAYARAFGAGIGCIIMGQFAIALIYDAFTVAHAPSFVIPEFGTLAGFEGRFRLHRRPGRCLAQEADRQGSRGTRRGQVLMDWLTFLKDVIATQQFLQVFVGGCTMMLIGWMVTRARGDREHLPPPAPASLADVPPPFLQGPREAVDLMRELRDLARRQTEDTGRIAECVRIIREESKRQTELIGLIEREQAIENRAHHERDRP